MWTLGLATYAINIWVKRTLWILAGLAAVGALVYAWLPEPVAVDLGKVQRGELVVSVDEDGQTRLEDRFVVSAPLGGTLSRIDLEPGDTLQRGDVIARVTSPTSPLLDERSREVAGARVQAARAGVRRAETGVRTARVALEYARKELQRQRELAEDGITTGQQVERAEFEVRARQAELQSAGAALQVARHELEVARAAVESLSGEAGEDREADALPITAPIEGVVLRLMRESEGLVQAGAPLVEIGRPASLQLVVDVLTTDAVAIEEGDPVVVERWGGDERLRGRVVRVEPTAFTKVSSLGVEERRVNVIVSLDSPAKTCCRLDATAGDDEEGAGAGLLGDGYRVEVRIITWAASDVLKVDSSAVFRHGEGWAVFRVADGVARMAPIEVGRRTDREVQVTSGLEAGQSVVLYPSDAVEEGGEVSDRR